MADVAAHSSVVIPKLPPHIVALQQRAEQHAAALAETRRPGSGLVPTAARAQQASASPLAFSGELWTQYPTHVRRQYLAMIETGGKGTHGSLQPLYQALSRTNSLPHKPPSPLLGKWADAQSSPQTVDDGLRPGSAQPDKSPATAKSLSRQDSAE